jgi:Na+/melibiose symporter-like transporter
MQRNLQNAGRLARALELGKALVRIVERSNSIAAAVNAFALALLLLLLVVALVAVAMAASADAFQGLVFGVCVFAAVVLICLFVVVREERHFVTIREAKKSTKPGTRQAKVKKS